MPSLPRAARATFVLCAGLLASACATQVAQAPAADAQRAMTGSIVAIDTRPWTYDGNAVVEIDSDRDGRVTVQLPARWNLCRAAPVDVQALSVGMRVQVVGNADESGGIVVCADEAHRLVPIDR